ncbi:hypothetical protein A5N82_10435 [Christensenella minuta]|nr:hypothetical protein B1H56_14000 [Christensenella minuta]OAQ41437.1 hypothetical protein A5N82_10435 [Christensenella minuta]
MYYYYTLFPRNEQQNNNFLPPVCCRIYLYAPGGLAAHKISLRKTEETIIGDCAEGGGYL